MQNFQILVQKNQYSPAYEVVVKNESVLSAVHSLEIQGLEIIEYHTTRLANDDGSFIDYNNGKYVK